MSSVCCAVRQSAFSLTGRVAKAMVAGAILHRTHTLTLQLRHFDVVNDHIYEGISSVHLSYKLLHICDHWYFFLFNFFNQRLFHVQMKCMFTHEYRYCSSYLLSTDIFTTGSLLSGRLFLSVPHRKHLILQV